MDVCNVTAFLPPRAPLRRFLPCQTLPQTGGEGHLTARGREKKEKKRSGWVGVRRGRHIKNGLDVIKMKSLGEVREVRGSTNVRN